MIGAVVWGYLSDMIGRKPAFLSTLIITMVGGFLASISTNMIALCLSLAFMGSGVGGNLPVDGALFLEFIPHENQSLLALLSLFWPVGQIITSLVALVFIPNYSCEIKYDCLSENNKGWRYTLATLSLLTFSMVLMRLFLFSFLESPKNLIARGKYKNAVIVVQELARQNNINIDVYESDFNGEDMETTEFDGTDEPITNDYRILFRDEIRLTFILVFLVWTLMSFGYTIFNGFLPVFLNDQVGNNPGSKDIWQNYFIIATFGIPGSVAAMYLSDSHFGRRGTMGLATFGTSASLFLFTMFTSSSGQLACSCLVSFLQNIMYGVLYTYSPEVFPTSIRGTAVGIASASSRLFGSIAPLVTGYLLTTDLKLPLYLSAGLIFCCSSIIGFLPPETRDVAAR